MLCQFLSDTHKTLEVMGKLALIREPSANSDLCQRKIAAFLKELFDTLDVAGDDVLRSKGNADWSTRIDRRFTKGARKYLVKC